MYNNSKRRRTNSGYEGQFDPQSITPLSNYFPQGISSLVLAEWEKPVPKPDAKEILGPFYQEPVQNFYYTPFLAQPAPMPSQQRIFTCSTPALSMPQAAPVSLPILATTTVTNESIEISDDEAEVIEISDDEVENASAKRSGKVGKKRKAWLPPSLCDEILKNMERDQQDRNPPLAVQSAGGGSDVTEHSFESARIEPVQRKKRNDSDEGRKRKRGHDAGRYAALNPPYKPMRNREQLLQRGGQVYADAYEKAYRFYSSAEQRLLHEARTLGKKVAEKEIEPLSNEEMQEKGWGTSQVDAYKLSSLKTRKGPIKFINWQPRASVSALREEHVPAQASSSSNSGLMNEDKARQVPMGLQNKEQFALSSSANASSSSASDFVEPSAQPIFSPVPLSPYSFFATPTQSPSRPQSQANPTAGM
ncbi:MULTISPECIES: hypothetical protein [Legionella]|uniref:hypothetical protein n=1 Tax=Legionella TaxID=445 RepID=UPI000F8DBDFC|nr:MULTISPECIES: hypothetical protein [Legionella]MCP0913507.1 hypothetical protein [Legionella sp. 27cVA30]RUQ99736.1 hypothetical protein ELY11_03930 [Legionella septentrionalis]RUR11070.1 hypothetical protein ELY14_03095 [Legionella septentrionalis]RUR15232.1 hypothetical protein ELY10_06400 [Legionella septentrionalis]